MQFLFAPLLCLVSFLVHSQEAVYRCGSEYTNDAVRARVQRCPLLAREPEVSVPARRSGTTQAGGTARGGSLSSRAAGSSASAGQRARDHEARLVIEAEIARTQEQIALLQSQYGSGVPSRSPSENEVQYRQRVHSLEQQLARAQADLLSLRRELARF